MELILLFPLLAGAGVAVVSGPVGCFIVWRRMAYLGDTISHSALLGVSMAILMEIHMFLGVFFIAGIVALLMLLFERRKTLSTDAILGILSHSSLAIGLVALSFLVQGQGNIMGYLLGEILAVSLNDIYLIYGGGAIILGVLAYIWRPLLADTTSSEIARAENMKPELARVIFMIMIAALIALTMKIIGILLITALLIIPAAAARRFASSPEQMALIAACFGILSVVTGLAASFYLDTPTSPSIVVAAFLIFVVSMSSAYIKRA